MTPTDADLLTLLLAFWLVAPCLGLLISNGIRRKTHKTKEARNETVD